MLDQIPLCQQYREVLPNEDDAAAIAKTMIANRYVKRDGYIPGIHLTPGGVCQNSPVHFHVRNPNSDQPVGRL